jgi:pectate lyase
MSFLILNFAVQCWAGAEDSCVPISSELKGYARCTTGGKDGGSYTVTSNEDNLSGSPKAGTLRYAIEKVSVGKPLRVYFNLATDKRKITLQKPLSLRDNLTIDGKKLITIATKVDWNLYQLDPKSMTLSRPECIAKSSGTVMSHIFIINRKKNIIINGLTFIRDNFKSPWDDQYAPKLIDKQCLGDVIGIYNDSTVTSHFTDNIWINNNVIQTCGDGCIDMTRPHPEKAQRISISNNTFIKTDKTMLLGSPYDAYARKDPATGKVDANIPVGKYWYRVSIYNNRFEDVNERNPRVASSLAHVFRNTYVGWTGYVVWAIQSKVFYESNVHENTYKKLIVQKNSDDVYPYHNTDMNGEMAVPDMSGYLDYRNHWITYPF